MRLRAADRGPLSGGEGIRGIFMLWLMTLRLWCKSRNQKLMMAVEEIMDGGSIEWIQAGGLFFYDLMSAHEEQKFL